MKRLAMRLVLGMWACGAMSSWVAQAFGAAPLDRYLADDVIAVASVDLTRLDLLAAFEGVAQWGIVPEQLLAAERQTAAAAQQQYAELPKRGARRAYALVRASDLQHGGTTYVVELGEGADAAGVVELLKSWLELARRQDSFGNETSFLPREFEAVGDVVLAASSPAQLMMLKESRPSAAREDAAAALGALNKSDVGLVVFGDPDSRRVMREMFPQMPAPFMEIDGRLLADGVKWGGLLVKLPPSPEIGLTIEAATPEVAATLEESATKGITLLKGLCMAEMMKGSPEAGVALPLLGLVQSGRDGTHLKVGITGTEDLKLVLAQVILPAVKASQESALRNTRVNKFKQIALGMLNYEAARRSLPPAASRDGDGKPLLSWRVHILPYLEQQELYNQFHLDEPWDSEHNRTLIAKIPDVYVDPEFGARPDGRTTFVVPVGEGTVFAGAEGRTLSEITDGLSNTILAAEVIPELAVVWTKPADWEVDLSDPVRGVRRSDKEPRGGVFTVAFCDGSVRFIHSNIDQGVWKGLLTRAGGEAISQ